MSRALNVKLGGIFWWRCVRRMRGGSRCVRAHLHILHRRHHHHHHNLCRPRMDYVEAKRASRVRAVHGASAVRSLGSAEVRPGVVGRGVRHRMVFAMGTGEEAQPRRRRRRHRDSHSMCHRMGDVVRDQGMYHISIFRMASLTRKQPHLHELDVRELLLTQQLLRKL